MDWVRWRLRFVPALVISFWGAWGCAKSSPDVAPAPTEVTAPLSPWKIPVYPTISWERFPQPELAGYRAGALDTLTTYLKTIPTTGMMVSVHGRMLYSYGNVTEQSYLASARKSVLSMLFGNYVAEGKIKLTSTLAQLGIDDRPPLSPEERQATVRDLLMTSSAVFHPASNPGDNLADAPPRGSQTHGSYFLYSNWDFNALGTIFETVTGRNIYDAIESDLARPIQMEDWRRDLQQKSGDSTRSVHLAYHMWFSTRDMARLGYLMLRQGTWLDKQVIPASWIRESTLLQVPSDQMHPLSVQQTKLGYGYLWWILEEPAGSLLAGGYSARGAYGQYIMVVPRLDMVIAHKRAIRKNDETSVTWNQFMEIARQLVGARCPKEECSTLAN
jgi:CubicO group peptidase (beta-lactamase class C family)